MDDTAFGKRNKKGDWAPKEPLASSALFRWPPQPAAIARWLLDFVWGWNTLFLAITVLYWNLVIPSQEAMATWSLDWVLPLFAWNWLGLFLFYGAFEWALYRRRTQAQRFKYNGKFPADQPSDVFWFQSQNIDNFIRSFFISIPIGTLIESFVLWMYASGQVTPLSWPDHAVWLVLMFPICALIQDIHFFGIHWTIHQEPLYKWVHSVHHNSINPTPWSSMSMHPVEGTFYFAVVMWLLLVPAHPFFVVHLFTIPAFGAIVGHIGFDRIELPGSMTVQPGSYAHYLHHKHFEVNYCDNGFVPMDLLTGSWHDGSTEGERRMQERYAAKVARLNPPG